MDTRREGGKMSRSTWRRMHFVSLGVVALLAAVVALALGQSRFAKNWEQTVITTALSQRPLAVHPDLRVITFTQSADQRAKVARLLDALRLADAKVILFGVRFNLAGPQAPDLELVRTAVKRVADSDSWIVVPRAEVESESKLTDQDSPPSLFERTPFDTESWRSRLAEGREPGRLLIGSASGFPATAPNGIFLHVVDKERNEEVLHVAAFAVAAFVSKDTPNPGLGEIRQYGSLGIVSLADATWRVLTNQTFYVRPISKGEPPTADIDVALASPEEYRGKLVVIGGLFGDPVNSDILGKVLPPNFDAAMVNTLLDPDSQLSPARTSTLVLLTVTLTLFAAFGSLGRLPWRNRPVHPAGSVVLGLSLAALALVIAWQLPLVFLDTWHQLLPAPPLLLATGFSCLAGWVAAAKFSRGFEAPVLPDRFDGEATVLFVDLKSSTPLVVKVGAEGAPRILGRFLRICTHAIGTHGGQVERTLGDGVLAIFFGPPIGKSDHAERALRAIQQIEYETKPLFAEVAHKFAAETGFTAGIETGPVTMEYSRDPGGWSWQSFGPTAHLAKRLQESSPSVGHSVVVGPGTYSAASREEFDLISLGPISAKGFDEKIIAAALQFSALSGKVTGSAPEI